MVPSSSSIRAALLWSSAIGLAGLAVLWLTMGQTGSSGRRGLKPKGLASIELRDGLALDVLEFGNQSSVTVASDSSVWGLWLSERLEDWSARGGRMPTRGKLIRVEEFQNLVLESPVNPSPAREFLSMQAGLKVGIQLREMNTAEWDVEHVYRDAALCKVGRTDDRVASVTSSTEPVVGNIAMVEVDDGEGNWVTMDGPLVIDGGRSFAIAAGPTLPGKHPYVSLRVTLNDDTQPKVVVLRNPAFGPSISPTGNPSDSPPEPPRGTFQTVNSSVVVSRSGSWRFDLNYDTGPSELTARSLTPAWDLWENRIPGRYSDPSLTASGVAASAAFSLWPGTDHILAEVVLVDRHTGIVAPRLSAVPTHTLLPQGFVIVAEGSWPQDGSDPEINLKPESAESGVVYFEIVDGVHGKFRARTEKRHDGTFAAVIDGNPPRTQPLRLATMQSISNEGQQLQEHVLEWAFRPQPGTKVHFAYFPSYEETDDGASDYGVEEVMIKIPKPTASP